jgi:hypothetical protein
MDVYRLRQPLAIGRKCWRTGQKPYTAGDENPGYPAKLPKSIGPLWKCSKKADRLLRQSPEGTGHAD